MSHSKFLLIVIAVVATCSASDAEEGTSGETAASDAALMRRIELPEHVYRYSSLKLPPQIKRSILNLDNTPSDNPITDEGATLGRVLFYDKSLSANGTTSCATCHLQKYAFSEPRAKSVGFRGEMVDRNSMSLVNLRFYRRGRFFWDERAATLEDQVLMPIENPVEMGNQLDRVVDQLQGDPIYQPLFTKAFGDPKVTSRRIARSLAQFVRSIVSFGSRYDIGLRQVKSPRDPFPNFTDQENLGKEQFFGRALCAECHLPGHDSESKKQWSVFQLSDPGNNGIDSGADDTDAGVASQTGNESDRGRFKPSSLRNLDLTGPYMHDGRFGTVDQVIEHYNWSVRPHKNLDPRLNDFAANGLALPEVPKVALAKFLSTLTDHSLIRDPKYSDPFVRNEATD